MFANCHFHSTFSDANITPAELVAVAKKIGHKALVLTDHDKPVINADVFNAIKEDRKVMEQQSSGDTKSFSRFENISSNKNLDATMPVNDLKNL